MIVPQPNTDLILHGDCLQVLKELPDNSVDSIVTDPPYGLSFMGKHWDYDVPSVEIWKECFRVLKHGGHILVACGTRTQHRMAVNIEDAGFEIRDIVSWIYGSGFPKSLNIGKQVDKIQGNEREVIMRNPYTDGHIRKATGNISNADDNVKFLSEYKLENGLRKDTKGSSPWEGYGTALKPAQELWTLARKPLSEKNVALNVLKWGTGGLNIDGSRIGSEPIRSSGDKKSLQIWKENDGRTPKDLDLIENTPHWNNGRFPANVILDEEAGKLLDEQSGISKSQTGSSKGAGFQNTFVGGKAEGGIELQKYSDKGGASRFFYCAKSSRSERNFGLDILTTVKLIKHKNIETLWKEENMELAQLLLKDILGLEAMSLNIGESGENIMVTCQKECLSIIKTTINKITELKTWNLLMQLLTKEYIQDVDTKMENGLNHARFVENLKKLMMRTGISQKKVGLVMEDVKSATLNLLLMLREKENDWQELKNIHSTVKPLKLMQYLVRLVTPKGGLVLDPFMGSGTTGIACIKEGFNFIGIEKEEEYIKIANARIKCVKEDKGEKK